MRPTLTPSTTALRKVAVAPSQRMPVQAGTEAQAGAPTTARGLLPMAVALGAPRSEPSRSSA